MTTHTQPDMLEDAARAAQDGMLARRIAADLLNQILTRRTPMDQALEESHDINTLPPRDRAFLRMMLATTLRRLGQVDDIIARATERNDPPEPPTLRHILRLGVTQILFMNVPDHAAVSTMVDVAAVKNLGRQKGLVNAVLRRVARDGADWIAGMDAPRINTPDWLMRAWVEDYGLRTAAEIAQESLNEAALDITLKTPREAAHWASVLEATLLPGGATLRRAAGGDVAALPGFAEGQWWVQDAAAAMPARLMGDVRDKNVLDLCAAPGGKTAQLAAAGAHVLALDRSIRRLQRLQENMERLGLGQQVRIEAADAAMWQPREKFDAILLDAPCSATGTIRRHPDMPHLKSPDDVERLCALQAAILDNAARMVKPGGVIVYCTCSLQKAEGEAQIDSFLTRHGDGFKRKPINADEFGGDALREMITAQGDVRVLPTHLKEQGGIDGFFIGRLLKL